MVQILAYNMVITYFFVQITVYLNAYISLTSLGFSTIFAINGFSQGTKNVLTENKMYNETSLEFLPPLIRLLLPF